MMMMMMMIYTCACKLTEASFIYTVCPIKMEHTKFME